MASFFHVKVSVQVFIMINLFNNNISLLWLQKYKTIHPVLHSSKDLSIFDTNYDKIQL